MSLKLTNEIQLTSEQINFFQETIYGHYKQYGRSFPWRQTYNPYHIVVSEIMLQQTQTYRVQPKYELFVETLQSFHSLAAAGLQDVLSLWQGLGYNRRGMALHSIAKKVVAEFDGKLPNNPEILVTFPGIGPATESPWRR